MLTFIHSINDIYYSQVSFCVVLAGLGDYSRVAASVLVAQSVAQCNRSALTCFHAEYHLRY